MTTSRLPIPFGANGRERATAPNISSDREATRPLPGDALLHPLVVVSVVVLIVNDHLLKAISPGVMTGKLSDVAGLAFFPLALVSAWEVLASALGRWRSPTPTSLLVATAATAGVFAVAKSSAAGNMLVSAALGTLQWAAASVFALIGGGATPHLQRAVIAQDPTDLIALAALGVSVVIGYRRIRWSHRFESVS